VVVNTCGFIDSAVAESLEAIGEALHENGKVIVTGCLGERRIRRASWVLAVTDPHQYEAVVEEVHKAVPVRTIPSSICSAARPGHTASLRLFEDLGRLQQPLQLLHHPAFARAPSKPADRRCDARGRAAGGEACRSACHLAGHERLRPISATPERLARRGRETRF
jgi:hypothetical protein